MNLILLAVLVTGLIGLRLRRDDDHLSPEQTCAVNGLFVLLVFLRHTVDYVEFGPWDQIFVAVNSRLDQLIVVPFLFYSGYGVLCSIRRKGHSYVAQLPRQRLLKVWFHFALAVLLYQILALCMGKDYPPARIALSYTGWDSIGNSNWYIFATLFLYAATWLSFTVLRRNHHLAAAMLTALAVGYILVMRRLKGLWWYDTALVYPAGVLYGLYRQRLEGWLRKPLRPVAFLVMGGCFALCYFLRKQLIWRELMAVTFALTVLLATMLFKIGNPVLKFLGKYTFEIYILQRLPMIILRGRISNPYVYLGVCFALTILIAVVFGNLLKRLDRLIFRTGEKQ